MNGAHPSLVRGKQVTKGVSLVKALSSGGMGAVWLADHTGLKTQVVVKFMLAGLDQSETARTRFSREAAAAALVKSPHVVQMLDHGVTDEGVPFIVMEHLEGRDLGVEIEKEGALPPATVVGIVLQVAKALTKLHAAGLLHRDIKPDNIFLCAGEDDLFVKLLDFGIVKDSRADAGDGSLDGETKTGQVVGTPFYMSPEQVTAQKVIDHRSDLWALGVVAYEAMTGVRPYDGPSFGALAVLIATGSPPRPSSVVPSLPLAVDTWFAKACAREASERFASAKEMADALRAAFDGVVSLPAASLDGDSGRRNAIATPSHPALAVTEVDTSDSGQRKTPLGRSEAGVATDQSAGAGTKAKNRVLAVVAGVVVVCAGAFVVATRFVERPHPARTETRIGQPREERAPKESVSVEKPSSSVPSEPVPAVAPSAVPPATTHAIAPRRHDAGTPLAKTAEAPAPHPTPIPKPTSTEPDLY